MKLYLKRNGKEEGIGFNVYDSNEKIIFDVVNSIDSSMKMTLESRMGDPFSVIRLNTLLFTYFTIRCRHHFYVLIPCVRDTFSFAIYGSTYKFGGSIITGSFKMTDSSGNVMMTMEKVLTRNGDEAFELNIYDSDHKMFLISSAVCAASYQVIAQPNSPQVCC